MSKIHKQESEDKENVSLLMNKKFATRQPSVNRSSLRQLSNRKRDVKVIGKKFENKDVTPFRLPAIDFKDKYASHYDESSSKLKMLQDSLK